jgi:hypothetical protein
MRRLTVLSLCLLVLTACSGSDREETPPPGSSTPDTTEQPVAPDTTTGSDADSEVENNQGKDGSSGDGLIDVTTLVRPENIYAAAAANAIAATAAQAASSGPVSWQTLVDSTVAIDTIEYPEIVEGLEVLEIDEVAVRVLTTTTAGEWGESYVCLTVNGVVASETLCTE